MAVLMLSGCLPNTNHLRTALVVSGPSGRSLHHSAGVGGSGGIKGDQGRGSGLPTAPRPVSTAVVTRKTLSRKGVSPPCHHPVTTLSPPRWLRENTVQERGVAPLSPPSPPSIKKHWKDWGSTGGWAQQNVRGKKTQELFRHPVVTPPPSEEVSDSKAS